ncbi:MAG: ABC transporter permease [Devosia sp.]
MRDHGRATGIGGLSSGIYPIGRPQQITSSPPDEQDRPDRAQRNLPLELIGLAVLLVLWQALAMLAAGPTPIAVAIELLTMASAGQLLPDLALTVARATLAFIIAMTLGTAFGLALGRYRTLDRPLLPTLAIAQSAPAIAAATVLYLWLGPTDVALLLALVVATLPRIATTVSTAARALDPRYDDLARAVRLPEPRRLRRILLPQLMPAILSAARSALSLIWTLVIVFELLGMNSGIGHRIATAFAASNATAILAFAAAVLLVILAVDYGILRPLERRLLAWREVPA